MKKVKNTKISKYLGLIGASLVSGNSYGQTIPPNHSNLEPKLKPEFEKIANDRSIQSQNAKDLISFYSQQPESVTLSDLDDLTKIFESLPTPTEAQAWTKLLIQKQDTKRASRVDPTGSMSFKPNF